MRSGDEDPRAPLETSERNRTYSTTKRQYKAKTNEVKRQEQSNATKQRQTHTQASFIQEKCHKPNEIGRK
jgi:hypothetical protein